MQKVQRGGIPAKDGAGRAVKKLTKQEKHMAKKRSFHERLAVRATACVHVGGWVG